MAGHEQLTVQRAMTEIATAERLAERFAEVFETRSAGGDVFAPDAFIDLNLSGRRSQLRGPDAFASALSEVVRGDVVVLRTIPTMSGFVTEHEERLVGDGGERTARRIWLCEVRGGRIVEAVCYAGV